MDKMFVYLGEDEAIKAEVEKYGSALEKAYASFFTSEQQRRIIASNSLTLRPSSFFHDRGKLAEKLECMVPEKTPNKFGLVSFEDDHKLVTYVSPFFYACAANFQHSGSAEFTDKMIASYVHEFDHHILTELQEVPIFAIHDKIRKYLEVEGNFSLPDYVRQLASMPLRDEEKLDRLTLAAYDPMLTESFEQATRILDHIILKSIGIETPLKFRGVPKKFVEINVFGRRMMIRHPESDPFYGVSNKEGIRMMIDWPRHLSFPLQTTEGAKKMLDEAKKRKYVRMSLDTFLEKAQESEDSEKV